MPGFTPSVHGNTAAHQRQIRKQGTAPLGPVSVGPGEGSLRFYLPSGDTFEAVPEGARVKFQGAMTGLNPLLEQHQTTIDSHANRLSDHDTAIGERPTKAYVDGQLAGKASSAWVTQLRDDLIAADAGLSTRITAVQGLADNAHSDAATAQARADSAHVLLAGKAASDWVADIRDGLMGADASLGTRVTAAQSRADSAWNLANGRATTAAVNAAQSRADAAHANAAEAQSDADNARVLANQIVAWINRNLLAPSGGGTFPSDIPR